MSQWRYSNIDKEMKVYGFDSVVKSHCRMCHGGCGVIAHVKDGKVFKVEGDPDSPLSYGTLCSKGLAVTQLAYHPDRILYPMKKDSNGWQRITWDEALDTVADRFNAVIEKYGAESIVIGQGTGRDYESHLYRFANLLGTPNVLTAGHMCYVSRVGATLITCGNLPVADWSGRPECILMWACNPQWTNPDEYKGVSFWRAYEKWAKLIVIDPRKGFLAKRADLWLQLRPGTDAALASARVGIEYLAGFQLFIGIIVIPKRIIKKTLRHELTVSLEPAFIRVMHKIVD